MTVWVITDSAMGQTGLTRSTERISSQ